MTAGRENPDIMSFSPLPDSLQKWAHSLAGQADSPQVVDLGCGRGDLARWFEPWNIQVWGLDRFPLHGAHFHIRGDALAPPIARGTLHGVLAGNLIHHMLRQDPTATFIQNWLNLLADGGWLVLLGDDPGRPDFPGRWNYRQLQEFLAELMPDERGALMPLQDVLEHLEKHGAREIRSGTMLNQTSVSQEDVLSLLRGSQPGDLHGTPRKLVQQIEKHGISYGRFWWLMAR